MGQSISTPFFFSLVGIFPNDFWVTSRGIIWDSTVSSIPVCARALGPPSAPHITEAGEDMTHHLWHQSPRGGGLCEVRAGRVFYISLWHGLFISDKHKNIFRILECIWNIQKTTQIYLGFSRGTQTRKSSGKLPLVNNFYIMQTGLLFLLFTYIFFLEKILKYT